MALTPLKFSALPAAAALGGTEAIPAVQTAANVKTTPTAIKDFTMGFAMSKLGDTGVGLYTIKDIEHVQEPIITGTLLHLASSGSTSRFMLDSFGTSGSNLMAFRRARGTPSLPTAVQLNDTLGIFQAFGYGATGYSSGYRAGVVFWSAENWTDAAQGTKISLVTSSIGGTALTTVIDILSNSVTINAGVSIIHGTSVIVDNNRLFNLRSYTVATLPTPGTAGRVAWASNCRVFNGAGVQEGAGLGTGGLVTDNGTAWKIAGTNVTAVA